MYKLLKSIFLSTPMILLFGLSIIIIGFILLFSGFFALSYYSDISISVGFVAAIFFALWQHRKVRRPLFSGQVYLDESDEKRSKRHWNLWREESKFVLVSGLLVSILSVTNYWYSFITAPVVFLLYGAFFIIIFYLINKGSINVSELKVAASKLGSNNAVPTFIQASINYFIILVLISGNWFYQIEKNESSQREVGYNTILNLVDYEYCSNSSNICGAVDSISDISFSKVRFDEGPGKQIQMCTVMFFRYAIREDTYRSDLNPVDICFRSSRFGSYWSSYEAKDIVRDFLIEKIES